MVFGDAIRRPPIRQQLLQQAFAHDPAQTNANSNRPLDLPATLDSEVFELPWLQGYGMVKSLQINDPGDPNAPSPPIARRRAEDFKGLVDKNFISRHGHLEKEQIRIEQEADLETQRSRLKEPAAAIDEAKGQRNSAIAETRRLALDTLNEAEQKATGYGQELVKSDNRGRRMTLIAPVDGTVQQLSVRTVGGVVTPAQALMVIVPKDDALEVEAFLENKDIGFVNAAQQAEVKIETFPFTKYGTIPASLVHVSRDAINDAKDDEKRRGPIYSTRARLQRATMQVEDKTVNLSAGMAVTAEIKTGKRRVIEYFLSPLLQHGSESSRER